MNVLSESDWTFSLVGETQGPQRPWQPSSSHLKRSRKCPRHQRDATGTDSRQEDQWGEEGPSAESDAQSRTRDCQEACPPSPTSCRRLSWSCPWSRGLEVEKRLGVGEVSHVAAVKAQRVS